MVLLPAIISTALALFAPADVHFMPASHAGAEGPDPVELRYERIGLEDRMGYEVFQAAMSHIRNMDQGQGILAIADMSRPSSEKRLTVIDLEIGVVLMHTYVAHGQGSGELMAETFSNQEGSHQTSLGLYRVGREIVSPKHGAALLLPRHRCRCLSRRR